jgi:Bifunctional DNA primase/polymerase, N-terminal/AAA domain/Primase C terminal 1 (PriCT-1)
MLAGSNETKGRVPNPRHMFTESDFEEAALWYARSLGWLVFPLHGVRGGRCTCGLDDCRNSGKHPRTAHGVHDATTDSNVIQRWWNQWPDANVGLATGVRSGVDALDVDPRHDGDESLRDLEQEHGTLSPTVTSLTGGGGMHLLFEHATGLKNLNGKLAGGLDIKTTGGYIVLPPSRHISGQPYVWKGASGPDQLQPAAFPKWLFDLIQGCSNRKSHHFPKAETVNEVIPQGRRNDQLTSLAGSMRRRGMDAEEIMVALVTVNQRRCKPPLPAYEVRAIADSVARYEPKSRPTLEGKSDDGRARLTVDTVPSIRSFSNVGIRWVVEGLIAEGTITMISGDSGVGKSTVVTAMAGAISCGGYFLSRATTPRPCLILDRENNREIVADRLDRLGIQDGPGLRIWGGWLEEEAPDPSETTIREWVLSTNPRPFILVDSLVAFNSGAENDSSETRRYLHGYRQLANLGATIVFLHHSGKGESTKDFRGSSDIKAAVDAAYNLAALDNDQGLLGRLRLRAFKSRFAEKTDLILKYDYGHFEVESTTGDRARANNDLLTVLLRENPGVTGKEFESKAAVRGVRRQLAREFLKEGSRASRVLVEDGDHNAKLYRWITNDLDLRSREVGSKTNPK